MTALAEKLEGIHAGIVERRVAVANASTEKRVRSGAKRLSPREVLEAMLVRQGIDIDHPAPGKRPAWVRCEGCMVPVKVARVGLVPSRCKPCTKEHFLQNRRQARATLCPGCQRPLPPPENDDGRVRRRDPRCEACSNASRKIASCEDCGAEVRVLKSTPVPPKRCAACRRKARRGAVRRCEAKDPSRARARKNERQRERRAAKKASRA